MIDTDKVMVETKCPFRLPLRIDTDGNAWSIYPKNELDKCIGRIWAVEHATYIMLVINSHSDLLAAIEQSQKRIAELEGVLGEAGLHITRMVGKNSEDSLGARIDKALGQEGRGRAVDS